MPIFDDYELGRTDEIIKIDSREDNCIAVLKMALQCRRTIDILSRELDPDLFDTIEFIDAVKSMVLANRKAKVRILVAEPKKIVSRGHRLVDLMRALPSYLDIRVPDKQHQDFNEMLFIADTTGYLHRLHSERFDATLNFNDKRVAKHLRQDYNEFWGKASQDTNLRQLAL